MQDKLFETALGIGKPWRVSGVEFDAAKKTLTIGVDFAVGTRFAAPGVAGEHPVHDTKIKRLRHLNFFQHECFLEVRTPRVTLPDGRVVLVEPLAGVLIASPDLGRLDRAPAPILSFLRASGGGTLALLVSLSDAGAVFNCMIATALTFGRMLFAAARDQALPAPLNPPLAHLSLRFGSPAIATGALALVAVPLCFVKLKTLIMISGNLYTAVYAVMALCVIAGRHSGRTGHRRVRAPLHPLAPMIVLASMVVLTLADLMDPDSGRPALIASGIVVGAGLLYALYVETWNTAWHSRDGEVETVPGSKPGTSALI